MKIKLSESKLRKIISETVKKIVTENYDNIPQILRLEPSSLNDDELKYCCRFLSANADEYTFNEISQAKFDSFFDEWKNRNSVIGESDVYDEDNYFGGGLPDKFFEDDDKPDNDRISKKEINHLNTIADTIADIANNTSDDTDLLFQAINCIEKFVSHYNS